LESTLQRIEEGTPFEKFPNFSPLSSIATHLPRIDLRDFELARIRSGVPSEVERLTRFADRLETRSRYVIAGSGDHPVALLERPEAGQPFRLQRIFVHETQKPS
jgi:hypothetical protein